MEKISIFLLVLAFSFASVNSEAGKKRPEKKGQSATTVAEKPKNKEVKTSRKASSKRKGAAATAPKSKNKANDIGLLKIEIEISQLKAVADAHELAINAMKEKKKSKLELDVEALQKKKVDSNVTTENFWKVHKTYDRLWLELVCLLLGMLSIVLIVVNGRHDKVRNARLDKVSLDNEKRLDNEKKKEREAI